MAEPVIQAVVVFTNSFRERRYGQPTGLLIGGKWATASGNGVPKTSRDDAAIDLSERDIGKSLLTTRIGREPSGTLGRSALATLRSYTRLSFEFIMLHTG